MRYTKGTGLASTALQLGFCAVALVTLPIGPVAAQAPESVPRAVTVARTTEIPACTMFVDAVAAPGGAGAAQTPHKTIAAAVARAGPGAVICVAEGTYAEQLAPGTKHVTLAGGFQRGRDFKVRDSAAYVSRAVGGGKGSFVRIVEPALTGTSLTVIDGFDISGYSQAIVREYYEPQRFDITNNHIHDNRCANDKLAGAGFALENISGRIQGNVIQNNFCGRGGGGFVNDGIGNSDLVIEGNLINGNAGTEPGSSHGGGLYLFVTRLRITANMFVANRVTQWGGGLYVGADTGSGQKTTAILNWNVYRGNRAGNSGGGFFCDDGAQCTSAHEIYDGNCGGNILLDSGPEKIGATSARFDQMTNINARDVSCGAPGYGVHISRGIIAPERYTIINSIFWGNKRDGDIAAFCDAGCDAAKIEIAYSMLQTAYASSGDIKVRFGEGIVAPADPLFADVAKGDYHVRSAAGRWTPSGRVKDSVTSPVIGVGSVAGAGPLRGQRSELGAYGRSVEAGAPIGTPAPVRVSSPPTPPTLPSPSTPASPPSRPSQVRTIAGCPVFQLDNIWNTPVDKLPVDPRSAQYVASIGSDQPLRTDFGSGLHEGAPIGIPYVVVPFRQPKVPIHFRNFGDEAHIADESDSGPYPIPRNAPIEGGPNSKDDRHVIVVQEGSCTLFEIYKAVPNADGSWNAVSAAKFDLEGHELRIDGRTSADAAGLPIFPGLVRFEEVAAGEIRHALRFTAPRTQRAYVWPARHFASRATEPALPPLGQRFRLRADVDISRFSPRNQVILRALKTYGMMLADNGSPWFLSGAPHGNWNDDELRELRRIKGTDFEAVDVSNLQAGPDSGQVRTPR